MPRIPCIVTLLFVCPVVKAQQKYSPQQVAHVLGDVADALDKFHPGAYRYQSKNDFAAYVDSVKGTIKDSATQVEMYRKIKPLVSRVGCLHTDFSMTEKYKQELNRSPNLLPLRLYFKDDKAWITDNFSNHPLISPGDEITTINGRSIGEILRQVLPAIPSDGYNQTMKYLALYRQFPLWYRHMVEVTEHFDITTISGGQPRSVRLKGMMEKDLAGNGFLSEPVFARQLELKIKDATAYLTIRSFADSYIKRSGQSFKPFMEEAFKELQNKGVKNLVIDLRDNTGGSDGNAAYLSGFFFDAPYRYWKRVTCTPAIAAKIKGVAKIWWRKPVQQDSLWLWQKGKRSGEFDYVDEQQPAAHPFAGKVYVLINGFCMSSCADLSAVLYSNRKGLFIGEETGGGYQGNNSGMMPGIHLKPSKMMLTVPLQKYETAVDTARFFGRGTMPDVPVELSLNDILQKRDRVMEVTDSLIAGNSNVAQRR
ncbi:S41 family peptidase [Chitinophaga sp. GCM10012297]|uniref:Tail specific protease domain-containing protein n=1 Tax=Chitinophaga chungangae TaxID=2821488 RepID=A0ABS3YBR6_9BACT|nr:S41 family peptidase [Chitinophaga chungangae]MBO9152096.1 hypothetical protein [Chitinophaga chungangae]